jgi:hypothetical protein
MYIHTLYLITLRYPWFNKPEFSAEFPNVTPPPQRRVPSKSNMSTSLKTFSKWLQDMVQGTKCGLLIRKSQRVKSSWQFPFNSKKLSTCISLTAEKKSQVSRKIRLQYSRYLRECPHCPGFICGRLMDKLTNCPVL